MAEAHLRRLRTFSCQANCLTTLKHTILLLQSSQIQAKMFQIPISRLTQMSHTEQQLSTQTLILNAVLGRNFRACGNFQGQMRAGSTPTHYFLIFAG
jgi:hypothetical protein